MNLHLPCHCSLTIAFVFTLILHIAGCEQRYVGGPVAIVKGTPPEHGMLGVTFSDPPDVLVLSDVLTDGPAFQAGMQVGDEILALGQQKVGTIEDVFSILRSTQPGDQLIVRVRRSTNETDANVILGDFTTIVALRSLEISPRYREAEQ
jgi:S1-C subfamily serine protease